MSLLQPVFSLGTQPLYLLTAYCSKVHASLFFFSRRVHEISRNSVGGRAAAVFS